MTDDRDIAGLAGEYVVGTLDANERAAVAARRVSEPALDSAILDWERRLVPLIEGIAAVAPPADMLPKIEARISGNDVAPAGSATIIHLRKSVRRWRAAALLATAVAASLIALVGIRELRPPAKQQNLVAVLQKDAASPAFLVTVNVDERTMTVRPVSAKREAGKSYELWIVQDSLGSPRSLGLIDDPSPMTKATLTRFQPDVIKNATYAVSLEPEGGSKTGAPTGPVVFAGKLIPAAF